MCVCMGEPGGEVLKAVPPRSEKAGEGKEREGNQTDIPALREDNAEEEADKESAGAKPAVGSVRGGFVEIALV